MDLHSRRQLMDSMSKRYRQASRASKKRILNEVCAATGFHRKYAITRINLIETGRPIKPKLPRKRDHLYQRETLDVIKKVWEEAGYPWCQWASKSVPVMGLKSVPPNPGL